MWKWLVPSSREQQAWQPWEIETSEKCCSLQFLPTKEQGLADSFLTARTGRVQPSWSVYSWKKNLSLTLRSGSSLETFKAVCPLYIIIPNADCGQRKVLARLVVDCRSSTWILFGRADPQTTHALDSGHCDILVKFCDVRQSWRTLQ